MAGVLLEPVFNQNSFAADCGIAAGRQARQSGADDTAVGGLTRRRRTRIRRGVRRAPLWRHAADLGIVRVQDIDVRGAGEVGMQRHAEQTAVVVVVDVRPKVREDGGCRVGDVVEYLDDAALLGDEHPAVAGEFDDSRAAEAADHRGLLKCWRRRSEGP